jgi:hypothetical protein
VDELDIGGDGLLQPVQWPWVLRQSQGGVATLFVADDSQFVEPALPLLGDFVSVTVPFSFTLGEAARVVEQELIELVFAEPRFDELRSVELVGDDRVRVRV